MMARFFQARGLNLVLRLGLGAMFLYAAWDKIAHPNEFAISVRAYQIIPVQFSNLVALASSWSEAFVGVLLILGVLTRKAAGAAFILLTVFTVAISTVIVRGMVIDCGCFGPEGGASAGPLLVVRNAVLLIAAYLVMRYNDGFLGLDAARRTTRRAASARS